MEYIACMCEYDVIIDVILIKILEEKEKGVTLMKVWEMTLVAH